MKIKNVAILVGGVIAFAYLVSKLKQEPQKLTLSEMFKYNVETEKKRFTPIEEVNILQKKAITKKALSETIVQTYKDPEIEKILPTTPTKMIATIYPLIEEKGIQRKFAPMDVRIPI